MKLCTCRNDHVRRDGSRGQGADEQHRPRQHQRVQLLQGPSRDLPHHPEFRLCPLAGFQNQAGISYIPPWGVDMVWSLQHLLMCTKIIWQIIYKSRSWPETRWRLLQVLHVKYLLQLLHECRRVLRQRGNINRATTAIAHQLTVCGDLHGKLDDLYMIFHKVTSHPPTRCRLCARPLTILEAQTNKQSTCTHLHTHLRQDKIAVHLTRAF